MHFQPETCVVAFCELEMLIGILNPLTDSTDMKQFVAKMIMLGVFLIVIVVMIGFVSAGIHKLSNSTCYCN